MRVQFIGVGEAFDELLPNNSQLLQWPGCKLLIDCGYAVPPSLWRLNPDPDLVDCVYLSHRHADHYFGLPSYVVRLAEDGRKRNLEVLCPEGMKDVILQMIEYAYQALLPKLPFALEIREVKWEEPLSYRGAVLQFAPSAHPVRNFAIAVTYEGKKYAYSGDGNFTELTRSLFTGCDLLVHEAYQVDEEMHGHACIKDLLQMSAQQKVKILALTHLQRDVRRKRMEEIRALIAKSPVRVIIPEVGDIMDVD